MHEQNTLMGVAIAVKIQEWSTPSPCLNIECNGGRESSFVFATLLHQPQLEFQLNFITRLT